MIKKIFIWLLLLAAQSAFAQVNCGMFCVQSIGFDTSGVLQAQILFEADSELFINYPYVSAVIDLQGDTVATGTLNFFGQFSNSQQEYPLETALLPPFDANFEGFVIFYYDSVFCELYYPCEPSSLPLKNTFNTAWKVFPNPAATNIQIACPGIIKNTFVVELFQSDGRRAFSEFITPLNGLMHVSLPELNGLYFLRISDYANAKYYYGQGIYLRN